MLRTAVVIGIYSYALLFLGILSQLKFFPVLFVTLIFFASLYFIVAHMEIKKEMRSLKNLTLHEILVVSLMAILAVVNLTGTLGPELAFDALWYHLTIPKLFIESQRIYFIADGLFYYSLMPKLANMLYMVPLLFWNEIGAKIIHFLFGVLAVIVVFQLARTYLTRFQSLLAALIFYASPVVGWLSITAYSDLVRAFYECLALVLFLRFIKQRKYGLLYASATVLGFAVCVKLLSIGSIPLYFFMIFLIPGVSSLKKLIMGALFAVTALIVPLPWFLISFVHTGNPVYPLFTHLNLRDFSVELFYPTVFAKTFISTFLFAPDPLLPFYLIVLPLIIIKLRLLFKKYLFVLMYSVGSYMIWYFTSQSGGTRFLTSYLPAYTVLGLIALYAVKYGFIRKITILAIVFLCLISIIYRGAANVRYIPFILGFESKQEFLMENLNFAFGDFYDENSYIKNIVGKDKVLLINMHNLYYVDFPFTLSQTDPEWSGKYILVQDAHLPENYTARIVYKNLKTKVVLYQIL